MGFLGTGNKKHQGQHRQEHLRLLSNNGDCVTFHRLAAYHMFLGSHFDGTLAASCGARHGSELFFTRHWTEFIGNMPPLPTTRAFFRVLVVFSTKSSGKQIHAKTIWLKKCVWKPTLDLKQKVFPRNKLKEYPIHVVKKWMIMEGLSNFSLTWGISQFPVT